MFAPVRYRFELVASVTGPTASFRLLEQSIAPVLTALAISFDAKLRLYATLNGTVLADDLVDEPDQPQHYRLHAVYSGSESSHRQAIQIRNGLEAVRGYYGLIWRQQRIESLFTS